MDDILQKVNEHFEIQYKINKHTGQTKAVRCDYGELGGLIGTVMLDDVVTDSYSIWAQPECYHWKVSGAKELPFKPCAGKLSIYEEQY